MTRGHTIKEGSGSVPLRRMIGAPMDLGRFLPIALGAAEALAALHDQGFIHKDVRPDHILVDVSTGRVELTGLELCSRLPRELAHAEHASLIKGSLAYMSPEQTGRMNRAIDQRSDLYSLGMSLYEMLAGRLPYRAADPLEWVHYHIAGSPLPPDRLAPGVPEVISAIVLRLLAKVAEERYQTARGLAHDLATCLGQWEAKGAIEPFPLGQDDVSDRFQIPQKLYGREREIRCLMACLDRVAATGTPELVLVSGYSGIGKSSLVQELHKPVVAAHGLFLSGKFEEHKRDIPYSTVVQAFAQIIRRILGEAEAKIAAWRDRLLGALGGDAQLIITLIPELELVIGPQPAVPPLALTEEKRRFYAVFHRFLGAFTSDDQPLLLFLDDLQWADAGSLALIQGLYTDLDTRNLLLVGAYRDNEVDPTHPLSLTLDAIRAAGARTEDIVLSPLSSGDLDQLLADALRERPARVRPLAALVEEKTRNNPFFVLHFLTTLHEEGLFTFDAGARRWSWDLGRIEAEGYTSNVVDFMAGKVNRLAPEAREALVRASCAGNEVHVATLAALSEQPAEAVHAELWEALRDGLMTRAGDTYRFAHDRVRQAAYGLIPEDRRAAMHLEIARVLLAAAGPDDLEGRVFDLVNQYNLGSALIDDPAERERVARLNLLAGRRARASTAYESAARYLCAGIRLLGPQPFEATPDLAYDLHFELAACAFLRGDLDGAAELLDALEPRAAGRLARAAIRRLEVDVYTSKDALDEAVARGALGLSLFGITVPPHPTRAEVEVVYQRVWTLLGDRRIEDLLELPAMSDPEMRAAQDILAVLYAPALNTDKNLPILVYSLMVENSLIHGNSDASALAYAYFGMTIGPTFGRYEEGHRFGKLGCDLLERRRCLAYRAKISFIFGDNTLSWTRHLREALPHLDAAFRAALETGDVTFACYCCNHIVIDMLVLGRPLDEVFDEAERRLFFTRKARFDASTQAIVAMQRVIAALCGRTAHLSTMSGPGFDEAAYEAMMDGYPWPIVTCWYYIMKLEVRFLAGEIREAVAAADRARELLWSTLAHTQEPEYWYYGALALAAWHDAADPAERPAIVARIREHERKLAEWAKTCPDNFGNKHALCEAELSRIEGRVLDAMGAYERAARQARENAYVQNEAIANEAAGRFHLSRGFPTIAAAYLREAHRGYAQWGAQAKVAQLEHRFPGLIEGGPQEPSAAIVARPEQLDLMAVIRASQAISREIDLARLIETLVRTVMQQAGAQKGLLLLVREGEICIEAEALSGPAGIEVQLRPRALSAAVAPESVINYVRRSRNPVILDDASRADVFSSDPYFQVARPRAVLCLPILRKTELSGLLYLENNLVAGAFTEDRLTVVGLLASQAAFSLENANLYAALRKSEGLLRAIVDNTTSAVYVKDLEGRIVLANRRLSAMTGLSDHALVGKTAHETLPPEPADLVHEHDREAIAAGVPMEWEETLPRPDGLHTYLSTRFPLRDAAGAIYGVGGISTDITQRVEAERERERLLHDAQEALRIRDEFLSIASHELRTPLTPLRLQVQLLRRRLADPDIAGMQQLQSLSRLVAISEHSVDRLAELVSELLDVSRISAGKLALHLEDVDLAAVVRETAEGFRQQLAAAGCALTIAAGDPIVGRWDRFRLEQVIVNLLSNAMKYGANKPIAVGVERTATAAQLWVRDEGIGIAKEAQGRIFDRYERAVSIRSFGGLGLGLYIARWIVLAHHGTIHVTSEPGRGALFTVEVPLDEVKSAAA